MRLRYDEGRAENVDGWNDESLGEYGQGQLQASWCRVENETSEHRGVPEVMRMVDRQLVQIRITVFRFSGPSIWQELALKLQCRAGLIASKG